jgi:peptidoglycan/xylan/chitin deacetylase (PgdA/CDA1 family)
MQRFLLALLYFCLLSSQASAQLNSPGAVSRFSPGGQYIMLTFSGGPHYYVTPKVLDILKEKKVKATFFVSGSKATNHLNLLKRMHNEKHEIGNHGFHNHVFTRLTLDNYMHALTSTNKIIQSVTNADVKHCRPPSGNTNAEINQEIKTSASMKVVLWSLDPRDVMEPNPQKIVDAVGKKAVPGDIVLLHDTVNQTILALPVMIDELYRQGYEFLTISEVSSFPDDSPH